jgi:hypothetical protein
MSAQASSSSTARSARALRAASRRNETIEEEHEESRAPSTREDEDEDQDEDEDEDDSELTPVPTPDRVPELTVTDILRLMHQQQEQYQQRQQQQQEQYQERFQQQQELMQLQQQQFAAALLERQAAPAPAPANKIFKMTDPDRFCGGATELDGFLSHLKRNFESHGTLFPRGDPDKIRYALGHLGTWASHTDSKQRATQMVDPITWSRDLERANHPCLRDFTQFETEVRRMYGDKDRRQKAALRALLEAKQGNEETVRTYAARIRSTWRDAEWDETSPVGQRILYDLAWGGLRTWIRKQIEPLQPDGGFNSLDELFDMAVKVEGPREVFPSKKSQYSKKSNSESTEKDNSKDKGKKRSHQQSKSSDKKDKDKLPPAEWLSLDEYKRRADKNLCMRCGDANHKSDDCPKFSRCLGKPGHRNSSSNKKARTEDEKTAKN